MAKDGKNILLTSKKRGAIIHHIKRDRQRGRNTLECCDLFLSLRGGWG